MTSAAISDVGVAMREAGVLVLRCSVCQKFYYPSELLMVGSRYTGKVWFVCRPSRTLECFNRSVCSREHHTLAAIDTRTDLASYHAPVRPDSPEWEQLVVRAGASFAVNALAVSRTGTGDPDDWDEDLGIWRS